MRLTFFSFLMSLLLSTVFILMIYFFRKKHSFIMNFGIQTLSILYIVSLVRIVFPYEFSFTGVISSRYLYTALYRLLRRPLTETPFRVTVTTLLLLIWVAGSLVLLLRFACQYHQSLKQIAKYEREAQADVAEVLEQVKRRTGKSLRIKIVYSPAIRMPMGVGVFRKKILLPDYPYPEEELYYVLLHEYTHFINHDLTVKMLVQIFCCVFWWNPAVYLLQTDLEQTLEIKCDLSVTKEMDKPETARYLGVILSEMKRASRHESIVKTSKVSAALFKKNRLTKKQMSERFRLVSESTKITRKPFHVNLIITVVTALLLFLSYSFVLQPNYDIPDDEIVTSETIAPVDSSMCYIVRHSDNTYELIFMNGKTDTIDKETASMLQEQGIKMIED